MATYWSKNRRKKPTPLSFGKFLGGAMHETEHIGGSMARADKIQ